MRKTFRRWAARVFLALLGAVVFGVIGQWFVQVATDKGWYQGAGKTFDAVMTDIVNFLTSPLMTYSLVAAAGLVVGSWADTFLAKKDKLKLNAENVPLVLVSGKTFRNEHVRLDGHDYTNCVFENVKFIYAGGPMAFNRNTLNGGMISPDGDEMNRYSKLLFEFGFLKVPVVDEHGTLAPSTKFIDD